MKIKSKDTVYYLLAVMVIFVWATTFVSSKLLLQYITPAEVMLSRFVIAFIALFAAYPKIQKPKSLRHEMLFLLAGIAGGSLYYLGENYALKFSQASNVSLLVSSAPIFTAIIAHIFTKHEKLNKNIILGFIIAFAGVFFVVFNGQAVLKISPLGDLLAVLAAISWAFYSLAVSKMSTEYNGIVITRRIFMYAIITILPFMPFLETGSSIESFTEPVVLFNLMFLGLLASSVCYLTWNKVIARLGMVRTTNFVYISPLITIIASAIVLHERITATAVLGGLLIFAGVYISGKKPSTK